ncbi:hypothetical protein [Chryseobacterium luteum]|uniref:hypothetical protein n=1 Tax=Chryseobacterium luteum TaxID=421531 RepID=UPI0010391C38|nr:hypothetical protein [Chryseobacterium luteum]
MDKTIKNVRFYLGIFIFSILVGIIVLCVCSSMFAEDLGYGFFILIYVSIGVIPISCILFIISSLIFKNKTLPFLLKVFLAVTLLFLIPILILIRLSTQ